MAAICSNGHHADEVDLGLAAGDRQAVPQPPILFTAPGSHDIVDVNAAGAALCGAAPQGLVGKPLAAVLRPAALAAGLPAGSATILRPDGAVAHVLCVSLQVVADGRPLVANVLTDVTAWMASNATVREERSFLERVVQTIPAALFVKDYDNEARYVLCTTRSGEMADLDTAAIVGARDIDLFKPDMARQFLDSDREVLTSGGMLVDEATVCRPDGRMRIIETKKMVLPETGRPPRFVFGMSEDITARRELELSLARIAMRDSLTGLANRPMFRDRLRAALAARQQCGGLVVLHSIDLDHFKGVNDTLGHAAGDTLLNEVARRMEAVCGNRCTVARLGGDEFAIIQGPIASLDEAAELASQVSRSLNRPIDIGGRPLIIGSSAGLAVAPDHGDDPDTLLRSADIALYGSKEQGRGTYRFFDDELAMKLQNRHRMEEDLREALANGQFELHYQPIVAIADGQVAGYEALLRWFHPVRGSVSPAVMIPLAEESGLIVPLGEWVLREACREAAGWARGRVSVNLSSVQFRSPGLAATVEAALLDAGLAAERLELEITESVLMADSQANLETLHRLRALGVRISLDDFGTGYSSLGYLNAFPFHKIKVDRSLVRDIVATPNGLAIVRSVIKLANDLGMSTTAEGVETGDQLALLEREGCAEVQGFLFDGAIPAARVRATVGLAHSRPRAAA